jgi:hypothetical protein
MKLLAAMGCMSFITELPLRTDPNRTPKEIRGEMMVMMRMRMRMRMMCLACCSPTHSWFVTHIPTLTFVALATAEVSQDQERASETVQIR